jgi:hypothetical protein
MAAKPAKVIKIRHLAVYEVSSTVPPLREIAFKNIKIRPSKVCSILNGARVKKTAALG